MICDRCEHVDRKHTRKTKLSLHACAVLQLVTNETGKQEKTPCYCDGFVAKQR